MGWIFTILVAVTAIVWLARRGHVRDPDAPGAGAPLPDLSRFSVTFRDGEVVATRGTIARNAWHGILDVAALTRLDGVVKLRRDGQLEFSPEIAPGVRQQLRNVWHAAQGR